MVSCGASLEIVAFGFWLFGRYNGPTHSVGDSSWDVMFVLSEALVPTAIRSSSTKYWAYDPELAGLSQAFCL